MSTSMYLFMGFISIGLVFFYTGCFLAAKPASGTTEWINYKCIRKFSFCPVPKPLTKIDIIPILLLTVISAGISILDTSFITNTDTFNFLLFTVGTVNIYLSNLMFAAMIPILYIFLKNLTGGYLIPISGIILTLLDGILLMSIGNLSIISANLFVLTAFYLMYRYTVSSKEVYIPFIGILLCIGMVFSASISLATIGIIAIFIIKENVLCLSNKDKKQTAVRIVLFTIFCLIVPSAVYFAAIKSDLMESYLVQLNIFDISSLSALPPLSLMVSVGGLMALPCCIYQAVKAKDGTSLFAIIPFAVYILSTLIFGAAGLLPIFAIPVICCSFTALHNRRQKGWIIAYIITAVLYIGSIFIFTLA